MGQSTRDSETIEEAIELLQQLGLKEYEARCFVGLSRLETGTAKQLSQLTEVPRTRVYDAIRVLETKGLVNTQHSSPKQFRAVPIDEGIETLRDQYEDRFERLQHAIATVDTVEQTGDSPLQEVWTMVGRTGIENRTNDLIDNANTEVVFVVGDESLLTEDLTATLNGIGNGVDLLIGATTPPSNRRFSRPSRVPRRLSRVWSGSTDRTPPRTRRRSAGSSLSTARHSSSARSCLNPKTNRQSSVRGSRTASSSSPAGSWPKAY